jgi:thioredoxin reductase (NADPH)
MKVYENIILGGGPAGVSAAIYLKRYRVESILITEEIGGNINHAHKVENYPGFKSLTGTQLSQNFKEHLDYLEIDYQFKKVTGIKKENNLICIQSNGNEFWTRTLLITSGTKKRKLNVSGEDELQGKGISYCPTCDAFFFKNKIVGVVGGNDSSASAAVLLADIAKKVYIIYRKEKIRAEPYWIEAIESKKNIEIITNANVTHINGKERLESVTLDTAKEINLDGLFITIGTIPATDMAKKLAVEFDEQNYIKVKKDQSTSVPNIWAAGDITDGSNKFRQVITACSEGAIASSSIFKYLKQKK